MKPMQNIAGLDNTYCQVPVGTTLRTTVGTFPIGRHESLSFACVFKPWQLKYSSTRRCKRELNLVLAV